MTKSFVLFAVTYLIVSGTACNSSNGNYARSDTKTVDTFVTQGDNVQTDTTDFSEINNYDFLKLGTMRIAYQNSVDSFIGRVNGDTLHTDGDVMLLFTDASRGVGNMHRLWPKSNGTIEIGYKIAKNYLFAGRVHTALAWWTDMGKLKFVERQPDEFVQGDHIIFKLANTTESFVGRVGGGQVIFLQDRALEGNIAHEVGHALGLYHEQSRSDRGDFVTILCPDDINYKHAYKQDPYSEVEDLGPYNFASIMHYAVDGCLKLAPKYQGMLPAGIPGQRKKITLGDFDAVRSIYKLN